MPNAVHTDKYRLHKTELMTLFSDENLTDSKTLEIKGKLEDCRIVSKHYTGKIGEYNRQGVKCSLYKNDILITQWDSFNDSSLFYQLISHRNGKEFLIFRQDLYGYSVLDIEKNEIMQFFPECSYDGIETFIWTGADYNLENNLLAVSGCYWACPYGVQLFSFENPMSEKPKCVDIISCLDGDYDVYGELIFLKWEKEDLHLEAFLVENSKSIEFVIPKEKYMGWLNNDKTAQFL